MSVILYDGDGNEVRVQDGGKGVVALCFRKKGENSEYTIRLSHTESLIVASAIEKVIDEAVDRNPSRGLG